MTVVDSAGIEIVETQSPLWSEASGWTLSDAPVLDIGRAAGDANEQFFGIAGVARLTNGSLVVADASASQLRFFDSDGRYLRASGGKGSGPGEFRGINRLYTLDGDSLLVSDGVLYRFSVFDPVGNFVRVFSPMTEEGLVWPLAKVGGGRILLATGRPFGGDLTTGVHVDSAVAFIADLSGAIHDSIGRFPVYERYVRLDPSGYRSTIGRPFGQETWMAGGGGRLFVTVSDAYQIYVYDNRGALMQIFRIRRPLRPVTDADIARYLESRERLTNERRRRVEARLLREIPFPETFPPFSKLVLDEQGYLWATEYQVPEERRTRWSVFDPAGRWLGTVQGPDGFWAYEIGRDYVLGVQVDELGVERVRSYRLRRSGFASSPLRASPR